MENNKKTVPILLSVLLLFVSCAEIIINIIHFIQSFSESMVYHIFAVLMIVRGVAAVLYCIMNYTKASAPFFKGYCYASAICTMFYAMTIATYFDENSIPLILLMAAALISFGLISALAVGKDLGKAKSFVFAGLLVVSTILDLLLQFVIDGNVLSSVGRLVGWIVLLIMIYSKYLDKSNRGSK